MLLQYWWTSKLCSKLKKIVIYINKKPYNKNKKQSWLTMSAPLQMSYRHNKRRTDATDDISSENEFFKKSKENPKLLKNRLKFIIIFSWKRGSFIKDRWTGMNNYFTKMIVIIIIVQGISTHFLHQQQWQQSLQFQWHHQQSCLPLPTLLHNLCPLLLSTPYCRQELRHNLPMCWYSPPSLALSVTAIHHSNGIIDTMVS